MKNQKKNFPWHHQISENCQAATKLVPRCRNYKAPTTKKTCWVPKQYPELYWVLISPLVFWGWHAQPPQRAPKGSHLLGVPRCTTRLSDDFHGFFWLACPPPSKGTKKGLNGSHLLWVPRCTTRLSDGFPCVFFWLACPTPSKGAQKGLNGSHLLWVPRCTRPHRALENIANQSNSIKNTKLKTKAI